MSLLLGVWLQDDCGWETNTRALCKKAYARIGMLTKLRYAGVNIEDLIIIYKQYIRSRLEYCSVVFHSSLTVQQSASMERCQAVCLRVILQESYVSYSAAMEMTGLQLLSDRRLRRCRDFTTNCIKDPYYSRFFPRNPILDITLETRRQDPFKVNFCRTSQYQKSAIPFCQRLVNECWNEEGGGEEA